MKIISYRCKFCHAPGESDYDDTCPVFRLELWQEILACTRCADFFVSKRRSQDRIQSLCVGLHQARNGMVRSDKVAEFEATMRGKLEPLARDYCHVVSLYLRIGSTYGDEMLDGLIEKPQWARHQLESFFKLCKKNKNQLQPTPRDQIYDSRETQMSLG